MFTGRPSLLTRVVTSAIRFVGAVADALGVSVTGNVTSRLTSASPPWFTTLGLTVKRTEFDGMPVWTIESNAPSDKVVIAVHGGSYIRRPQVFHWLNYASIARDTDATVVVPIYQLAPQGNAETVVPVIADLFADHVRRSGADNVSVYGDSAGGGLSLAAVQEMVRRGIATPGRMVLISPWLDVTMTDPRLADISDPVQRVGPLREAGTLWAGQLDTSDPRVSPINGSLAGLPTTVVYSSSLDLLSADTLRLRDRVAEEGADVDFVLRRGLIHDWPIFPFPESFGIRDSVRANLLGWPAKPEYSHPSVRVAGLRR